MEGASFNSILGREPLVLALQKTLQHFETNKHNLLEKRGLYVYGAPGTGKTTLVMQVLKDLNYDVIKYDAGDIRNKSIMESITSQHMAERSVASLLCVQKKPRRMAIVMDEVDGMNNGDKGGLTALIKLIRPKKTKKQKNEELTYNPIICVSSYHLDKKLKELMKVCYLFEMPVIKTPQVRQLQETFMPHLNPALVDQCVAYTQGDLRKLNFLYQLYVRQPHVLQATLFDFLCTKSCSKENKDITKTLLTQPLALEQHGTFLNETARTTVGLLWHENIIDVLAPLPKAQAIPVYNRLLHNICFADYVDRITFQRQIWQFNEMSSLMKTFHTNKIYHDLLAAKKLPVATDMRFTKVLTKYSTEYNNALFVHELCQKLNYTKSDTFAFFLALRAQYKSVDICKYFKDYDISKLDLNRIYRYLDKYTNKACKPGGDDDASAVDEEEEKDLE